jgi:hypothetical protein
MDSSVAAGHRVLGGMVANGFFRFAKSKSAFLRRTIELFVWNFNHNVRSSGGSIIMTRALKESCSVVDGDDDKDLLTGKVDVVSESTL